MIRFPLVIPIVLIVLVAGGGMLALSETSFRSQATKATSVRSAAVLEDLVRQVGLLRRAHETYVRLLSDTPGLTAALAAKDSTALREMLAPIQAHQAFDEITIYDDAGGEVLHLGPPKGDRIDAIAFASGLDAQTTSEATVTPTGLVVLASTPINDKHTSFGVLVVASTFTDKNVGELRGTGGVELAFLQGGTIVSTSITDRALRRVIDTATLTPRGLTRLNNKLDAFHLHAAVDTLPGGGELLGLASTSEVAAFAHQRNVVIIAALGLLLGLALVITWFVLRTIVRPIKIMAATTEHMLAGDYGRRVAPSRIPELDTMGQALNYLAERVDAQIEDLSHQAFHDHLTGLPNRALFVDRLDHTLTRGKRTGEEAAVLFLDLDNFKLVNDTLGHALADQLLVAVAERLGASVRGSDTLARLSGDEFTVLLEEIAQPEDALVRAELIGRALEAPFELAGHELFITVSIGIALSSGRYDSAVLLREADLAMYRAKVSGKGRCELFDGSMSATLADKLSLQNELRHAVARDELRLFYQPIVDLGSGEILEVEALVRWQHPTRGLLLPDAFIPAAEDTGVIVSIGEWVLSEGCQRVRDWRRRDGEPVALSINLSPKQFQHPDLVASVDRAVSESGFDRRHLKFEITERSLMERSPSTLLAMDELSETGIRFLVDDFGTGYSALSYLQDFPVRGLKIDKSFVDGVRRNEKDPAIIAAIVAFAAALDLEVTVEGVEDFDQVAQLRALGCRRAQGFFFARPVPLLEIEPLIFLHTHLGQLEEAIKL